MAFQCIYERTDEEGENENGKEEVRFLEEKREERLPGLLYADEMALCGVSEEDLRAMLGHFV